MLHLKTTTVPVIEGVLGMIKKKDSKTYEPDTWQSQYI